MPAPDSGTPWETAHVGRAASISAHPQERALCGMCVKRGCAKRSCGSGGRGTRPSSSGLCRSSQPAGRCVTGGPCRPSRRRQGRPRRVCLVSGTCSTTSTTPNRHSGRRSRERRSVAVRRVGSARDTRNSLGKRFGRWPTNVPSTGSRHPSGSRQMSCVCHASRAFSPSRYRTTAISRLPPLWLASRSSAGVCVGSGGARCIRATRAPSVVAKSWSRLRRSPTRWP